MGSAPVTGVHVSTIGLSPRRNLARGRRDLEIAYPDTARSDISIARTCDLGHHRSDTRSSERGLLEGELIMRTRMLFVATVATTAMAIPGAALAHDGPPVDVFTETVNGSDVIPFTGPCGGGPATASIEFHDKFHVTAFDDGHVVVSGNQAGTFESDPLDPAVPSSSGRYRNGFTNTFTQNAETDTSVFNVVGRNENGAQVRFQVRSHVTFANGELRVDNFTVSCP